MVVEYETLIHWLLVSTATEKNVDADRIEYWYLQKYNLIYTIEH